MPSPSSLRSTDERPALLECAGRAIGQSGSDRRRRFGAGYRSPNGDILATQTKGLNVTSQQICQNSPPPKSELRRKAVSRFACHRTPYKPVRHGSPPLWSRARSRARDYFGRQILTATPSPQGRGLGQGKEAVDRSLGASSHIDAGLISFPCRAQLVVQCLYLSASVAVFLRGFAALREISYPFRRGPSASADAITAIKRRTTPSPPGRGQGAGQVTVDQSPCTSSQIRSGYINNKSSTPCSPTI
jgi:hypothetical protein